MPEIGEHALVRYRGRLDDGREFERTPQNGEPLEVKLGSGRLLPLVEKAICDMSIGDRKTIRLEPGQAYGSYDEDLVIAIPRNALPNADELPVGRFVEIRTDRGTIRAKVTSIDPDSIVLDCNHELAGQAVTFEVELVAVVHETAIDKELHPAGCACGCDRLKEQIG